MAMAPPSKVQSLVRIYLRKSTEMVEQIDGELVRDCRRNGIAARNFTILSEPSRL